MSKGKARRPKYMDEANAILNEILPKDAAWCLIVQPDQALPDGNDTLIVSTAEGLDLARGLRAVARKLGGDA